MSRYKLALEEYEIEDEDGKIKLVYAYFGLAIYFSQVLEETFSIMLWTNRIFQNKVKTNKEVRNIIYDIENSRKTMGKFINEVKNCYELTDLITNDLKDVLDKRNYLTHSFFKLEIQKFYSDLGRKEMIEYFCIFIDKLKKIDSELGKYYSKFTLRMGFTEDRIDELINEMKNEELEREKSFKINNNN